MARYRADMYKGKDWPEYSSENEEYTELSSFSALKYFILRDFERINRKLTLKKLLKSLVLEPGFKYVFWLRITRYSYLTHKRVLFFFSCLFLKHYAYKYGFDISFRTHILPGFAIGHWGSIIIAGNTVIGSNCFVRPGVVMGKKSVYKGGTQVIGDNVEFGAGAKCIGELTIGNHVTIGANAVVTHSVPDNCVVAGIPARIIKRKQ